MKIIDGYALAGMIKKTADKRRDSGLYILAGLVTGFVNDMQEAEAYTEAKKHLENLQKVNEDLEERIAIMEEGGWHPVSERPKKTDDYIVRIDCGVVQITSMRNYIASLNKWVGEDRITHWMPLPEPPKEGEQE